MTRFWASQENKAPKGRTMTEILLSSKRCYENTILRKVTIKQYFAALKRATCLTVIASLLCNVLC